MIHLGTSGYVYDDWRNIFYPKGLPARRWLEHYSRVFSTVELNATFYRLPTASTVDAGAKERRADSASRPREAGTSRT